MDILPNLTGKPDMRERDGAKNAVAEGLAKNRADGTSKSQGDAMSKGRGDKVSESRGDAMSKAPDDEVSRNRRDAVPKIFSDGASIEGRALDVSEELFHDYMHKAVARSEAVFDRPPIKGSVEGDKDFPVQKPQSAPIKIQSALLSPRPTLQQLVQTPSAAAVVDNAQTTEGPPIVSGDAKGASEETLRAPATLPDRPTLASPGRLSFDHALQRGHAGPAVASNGQTAIPAIQGEVYGDMLSTHESKVDALISKQPASLMMQGAQHAPTPHLSPTAMTSAATSAAMQVAAAIKAERQGPNIEVRLDPPELGRVRIEFSTESIDAVKAVLTAERSETLDHLRRNVGGLLEELKLAGFGSVDLEFSDRALAGADEENAHEKTDFEAASGSSEDRRDVVYLSLRDDARLNLLV